MSSVLARSMVSILVLICLGFLGPRNAEALDGFPFSRENPAHILGAQACAECHDYEYEAWGRTAHAESFSELHKRKRASEIAGRLGFKRGVKRDTRCLTCHFTSEVAADGKREIAKAGVSCESCHGAGKNWKDIHNNTDRDRNERLKASIANGMRPPSDFYAVVSNCFQCHIVAFEELVNVGKHTTGSGDFDMQERVDEIRHSFLESRRSGAAVVNKPISPEHGRVLQVAGVILRAEYALRALAQSTTAGTFYDESKERAEEAVEALGGLAKASGRADMKAMARAVEGITFGLGKSSVQLRAADQLSSEARKFFAARPESFDLAFVDSLDSGGGGGEADASGGEGAAGGGSPSSSGAGGGGSGAGGGGPSAGGGGSGSGGGGRAAAALIDSSGLAGAIARNQLQNGQQTVKASSCKSSCHESESKWWKGHAHSGSAKSFAAGRPKHVQIARALGISGSQLATGKSLCMSCHGTVVSGKESATVDDGVSCQSCHGSAGKFLKPHQDGDGEGYSFGMHNLGKPAVRAQACAGCHIIDYKPLLEAGHPTGKSFDFTEAIGDIKHWERDQPSVGEQASAFAGIQGKRPIPAFQLADLGALAAESPRTTPSRRPPPPGTQTERRDPGSSRQARQQSNRTSPPKPAREEPEPFEVESLPPWPEAPAGGSIEDDMRLLQERLGQIYQALFGGASR